MSFQNELSFRLSWKRWSLIVPWFEQSPFFQKPFSVFQFSWLQRQASRPELFLETVPAFVSVSWPEVHPWKCRCSFLGTCGGCWSRWGWTSWAAVWSFSSQVSLLVEPARHPPFPKKHRKFNTKKKLLYNQKHSYKQ